MKRITSIFFHYGHKLWYVLGSVILLASFLLSGCGIQSVVSMEEDPTPGITEADSDHSQEAVEQGSDAQQEPEQGETDDPTALEQESQLEAEQTSAAETDEAESVDSSSETEEQNPSSEQVLNSEEQQVSEGSPSPEETKQDTDQSDYENTVETESLLNGQETEISGVSVSTVDEFLAALAPNTAIILESGVYNLSEASDYGQFVNGGVYNWEECYDGYQLVISEVDGLSIYGRSEGTVTIAALPRYANVLTFRNCTGISLSGLTAGHTQEPGYCAGGVLEFGDCNEVEVDSCRLFGCGVLGVNANNSSRINVLKSEIYECSIGAVSAVSCRDFTVSECCIHSCGLKNDAYNCYSLFETNGSTAFAVVNCEIRGNDSAVLLKSEWSKNTALLGCEVLGNKITESVFVLEGYSPIVGDCSFNDNEITGYYPEHFDTYAVNEQGDDLISFDFEHMQHRDVSYEVPAEETGSVSLSQIERADGSLEYHVSNVDELLAAIGPNRTVYLDAKVFDLSSASNYGINDSEYYRWENRYDGPGLVISNISDFQLIGQGKSETKITATPRYADVIRFEGGERISISNLTAGHTEAAECSGDVLSFSMVDNLIIDGCGLFGCGVNGIYTWECQNIAVLNCEIYSCSNWAVAMMNTGNVEISGMNIHDMPSENNAFFSECKNVYNEGIILDNGEQNLMK